MEGIAGRVFLVMGGAGGVGRATCTELLRAGGRVLIADLGCATDGTGSDPDVALRVARELDPSGQHAQGIMLDCRDTQVTKVGIETAVKCFGRVDGGVYCAAVDADKPLARLKAEDLELAWQVHVRGAVLFTRELSAQLVDQGTGGAIVLMCSATGLSGVTGQTSSALTAGAIATFTRASAAELRRKGVRINAVAPTARTRLTENLPMFRAIRGDSLGAEHVAPVVSYLLSEAGQNTHGEVLGVAGGRIYALRSAETGGLFQEGAPIAADEVGRRFREITGR